jgi:hypothetical protein
MSTRALPLTETPPSYQGVFGLFSEGKLPLVAAQAEVRAEMLGSVAELGGDPYGPRACQPVQRVQ